MGHQLFMRGHLLHQMTYFASGYPDAAGWDDSYWGSRTSRCWAASSAYRSALFLSAKDLVCTRKSRRCCLKAESSFNWNMPWTHACSHAQTAAQPKLLFSQTLPWACSTFDKQSMPQAAGTVTARVLRLKSHEMT